MKTPVFSVHRSAWAGAVFLAVIGFAESFLQAQPLTGGSFVLVGAFMGGGVSSGGPYAITGWAASAGAGTSTGAGYELTCGLLGVYVIPGGDVALKVELTSDHQVRIWWPADVAGYQLEFTTALGPGAVWQRVEPAPVGNSYTTGPVQPAHFFRLRKP